MREGKIVRDIICAERRRNNKLIWLIQPIEDGMVVLCIVGHHQVRNSLNLSKSSKRSCCNHIACTREYLPLSGLRPLLSLWPP